MARSPLLAAIRRSVRLAQLANRPAAPPVDELLERYDEWKCSRRSFLRQSAAAVSAAGAATLLPGCLSPCGDRSGRTTPRIVIVGAGMAGLTAAHTLMKAGLRPTIYEAAQRTGGRMFSVTDTLGPGLVTELGGEFLDSTHNDLFALARELGLEWVDMRDDAAAGLVEDACFFAGRHHGAAEVIEAFRSIAARLEADRSTLGVDIDHQTTGRAADLDRLSIAEYLDRIGASGLLRSLLEVAYVTEYGLDCEEQSALNLLSLIGLDTSEGFEVFGDSDERYKIRGGNQRVTDALTERLDGRIVLDHRLEAVRSTGSRLTLTFARRGAGAADVTADLVLLTIPFSILRSVRLDLELPPVKRRAIAELGYGTNAKLLVGVDSPVWRRLGYAGNVFSDEAFQLAWDNSRLQGREAAGLTLYSGGRAGLRVGEGPPAEQADRLMPGVESAFPGVLAARNDRVARFHWPTHPHTLGSYACYRPGQWTGIRGGEFPPVGNLYFAGEHCSLDFQGFMNGAAETGRRAAERIAARARRA